MQYKCADGPSLRRPKRALKRLNAPLLERAGPGSKRIWPGTGASEIYLGTAAFSSDLRKRKLSLKTGTVSEAWQATTTSASPSKPGTINSSNSLHSPSASTTYTDFTQWNLFSISEISAIGDNFSIIRQPRLKTMSCSASTSGEQSSGRNTFLPSERRAGSAKTRSGLKESSRDGRDSGVMQSPLNSTLRHPRRRRFARAASSSRGFISL